MPIATKCSKIDISNEKTTKDIAEKIASKIKLNTTLLLFGEIGVGKTTFTKYFINYFQKKNKIQIDQVISPTFNILCEYEIRKFVLQHYDLYRIKKTKDLNNIGILENCKNKIRIIEWPELLIKKKIPKTFKLFFSYDDNYNKRYLKMPARLMQKK